MNSAKEKIVGVKAGQSPDELESNALIIVVMGILCAAALVHLFMPFFSRFVSEPSFSGLNIPENTYVSNNFVVKEDGASFTVPCGCKVKLEAYMRPIDSVDMLWRGQNARVLVEDNGSFDAQAESTSSRWSNTIYNKRAVRDIVSPKLNAEFTVDERYIGKWLTVSAEMDVVYPVEKDGAYQNKTERLSRGFKVYVISADDFRKECHLNWMLYYKYRPAFWLVAAAMFAFMCICFYRALWSFKKGKELREQQEAVQTRWAS